MAEVVYLVDASTFIHRSYHAIRHLATSDGRPTNAVFGFVATLNKLLNEKQPEYLAVAYDAKGPSFRKEMYPDYKANRPPMPEDLIAQQEPIRNIVKAMGLTSLEIEGIEADDIIATLTEKALAEGFEVVIVSADKDFYQLLSDKVMMYDPNPKRESAMTPADFAEKFGIRPEQFLDVQGLMGDSSDNIPGVPGVGEKTAVKLIGEHETLENLYQNLDKTKGRMREKLEQNKDSAFASRELARLKRDADLDLKVRDLRPAPLDREALLEIYRDLDFSRFAGELEGDQKGLSYDDYHLVTDEKALDDMVEELSGAERLSVDLETDSIEPVRADIVGISLSASQGRAFYIPVGHRTLGAVQLPWKTVAAKLGPLLESEKIGKIGQNIKYDYIIFKRNGITLGPIVDDSMIASYLLEPGTGGHNLDRLSEVYLGHTTIKYKEVVGTKGAGFDSISPEAGVEYACEDADAAFRLAGVLRPMVEAAGLLSLYQDLELPLVEVLAEIEMNGVLLDRNMLEDISRELAGQMKVMEEKIYNLAGREFNINSPKQLGQLLFEELKLPMGKKTKKKSGYSTDVEVLTDLAVNHELPAEVLNYRSLTKLKSTYADALAHLINPETGRVHTSFNQAVTATGRLSSSDPNLQNIPVRTGEGRRIREAFIADKGSVLLAADYSQVELRVLAHYTKDPGLTEAFEEGEDVHTRTAAEVFDMSPLMVTPEMRREAKAINFGIAYGQGAFGLSRQLGIERKDAQNLIDRYFKRYAGVKQFIDDTLTQAKENGYVTTLLGRRRALPELKSKSYQVRSMAERMAINTPIQGTAADIIKMAMLAVHRALKDAGLKAKMVLQVHDELVFEVPESELEILTELVREKMEGIIKLDVPLVVDINHGANWAEAH